jgi:DNA-directed RNA polymerase specialized sigma subunit
LGPIDKRQGRPVFPDGLPENLITDAAPLDRATQRIAREGTWVQVVTATTRSMQDKLRRWNYLVRRKVQLEQRIAHYEGMVARYKDALSADGLLSDIVQQYEGMVLGLPRASNYEDKMAEKTTRALDGLKMAQERLDSLYGEYAVVCRDIEEIEDAVAGLDPRYQRLLQMYYRDKLHWRDICDELYISKARMYQMIEQAIRVMSWGL